jgi:hypothetical protein
MTEPNRCHEKKPAGDHSPRPQAKEIAAMHPDTLEALNGSIAKWAGIVAGTDVDLGACNCPLCQKFHSSMIASGRSLLVRCDGCPVLAATGQHGCRGSPYEQYEAALDDPDEETLRGLAQSELDFLKSLLPRGA